MCVKLDVDRSVESSCLYAAAGRISFVHGFSAVIARKIKTLRRSRQVNEIVNGINDTTPIPSGKVSAPACYHVD